MRLSLSLAVLLLACASCRTTAPAPGGTHYGEPLEGRDVLSYAVVSSAPSEHLNQTLLVEATVVAVCQSAGCWMQVEDGGETAMVRWETGCGGKYAFPKDAAGKRILIQGSFYPKTISPEDVEHLEAEAGGKLRIPEETWEFNASAVVVYD